MKIWQKQESFSVEGQPPTCQQVCTAGVGTLPTWTSLNRSGAKTRKEFHVTYHMGTSSSPQRTDRQTDTTENISFPLTTYAGGKKCGRLKVVILDQPFMELVNNNIQQTFCINDKYFVFEVEVFHSFQSICHFTYVIWANCSLSGSSSQIVLYLSSKYHWSRPFSNKRWRFVNLNYRSMLA